MSKEAFKWSDDQIEALIDLVKGNEAIFDMKHYNHRNRQAIDNIWSKIDMELKKPPGVSREQWQKLRICYRRNFSSEGPKARWRFYDKLNFLSEFLRFIDPENSLTKCIKRAEEKYFTHSGDSNPVGNTPSEDDDKPDDQTKSEDNISIYYLTDEEVTIENDEHDESDNESEFHLVEYIDETEAMSSSSKHESNKMSINTIKKTLKKRKYQDRVNYVPDTVENVSSSKDEDETIQISEEPDIKTFRSNSPSKDVIISTVSQNIVTTKDHTPKTCVISQIKSPIQIEPLPINVATCLCQNDPDTIFLRSILEDFKSMSKKNKCSFKIKVQKAIQDILYPDDE